MALLSGLPSAYAILQNRQTSFRFASLRAKEAADETPIKGSEGWWFCFPWGTRACVGEGGQCCCEGGLIYDTEKETCAKAPTAAPAAARASPAAPAAATSATATSPASDAKKTLAASPASDANKTAASDVNA